MFVLSAIIAQKIHCIWSGSYSVKSKVLTYLITYLNDRTSSIGDRIVSPIGLSSPPILCRLESCDQTSVLCVYMLIPIIYVALYIICPSQLIHLVNVETNMPPFLVQFILEFIYSARIYDILWKTVPWVNTAYTERVLSKSLCTSWLI